MLLGFPVSTLWARRAYVPCTLFDLRYFATETEKKWPKTLAEIRNRHRETKLASPSEPHNTPDGANYKEILNSCPSGTILHPESIHSHLLSCLLRFHQAWPRRTFSLFLGISPPHPILWDLIPTASLALSCHTLTTPTRPRTFRYLISVM